MVYYSSSARVSRIAQLTLCVLLLIAVSCVCTGSASFIRARHINQEEVSEELVKLINERRRQDNKAPVCTNLKLTSASRNMADDMAETDYFHGTGDDTSSPAERVSGQRFVFTTLTEDVAAGYESAADALEALMSVQEHRDNILGDYQFVGAGYSYGSRTGYKHFWSLHFANAINEYCDLPVEKKPVEESSVWRRWLQL